MSCTVVLTPSHSMTAPPSIVLSPTRYHRAQSSPAPSAFASSNTSSSIPPSASDAMADSVSMLAALPSLSKSLNNLPSLAGQSSKHVPVYEGMPSRAQKSSHEKLKMALGNSSGGQKGSLKDALAAEKKGFYASPFFSMTPMSASVPVSTSSKAHSYPLSTPKQKTFSIYSDEDDEDEDESDN